jgi:hypothetical protein
VKFIPGLSWGADFRFYPENRPPFALCPIEASIYHREGNVVKPFFSKKFTTPWNDCVLYFLKAMDEKIGLRSTPSPRPSPSYPVKGMEGKGMAGQFKNQIIFDRLLHRGGMSRALG